MKFIFTVLLILSYSFESQSETHGSSSGLQCNIDKRHFEIKYEISKSTLPKSMFKIEKKPNAYYNQSRRFILVSGNDLFHVAKKKHYSPVNFKIDETTWHLLSYSKPSEGKVCNPSEPKNTTIKQDWNCYDQISDTTPKNKPYMNLTPSDFSKAWPSDLKKNPKKTKKTFTKDYHFIQNGELHTVTVKATASKNEKFLKNYSCVGKAKVKTCGEGCIKYSTPLFSQSYDETDIFRLNLSTEKRQAIVEFRMQYYPDGNDNIKPNLRKLKESLEKTLSAQEKNLKKGLLFYSLSSISSTLVKDTSLSPSEIKFVLH
ncbi:MAG: hypothetical protein ACRBBP_01765 [Bdellovibrionales bacterium]